MILIISKEQDESTIDIIKWLYYLEEKFILLNNTTFINHLKVDVHTAEVLLTYGDIDINFNDITAIWYRRGNFEFPSSLTSNNIVEEKVQAFLDKEKKDLVEYLHFLLDKKFSINNYNNKKVNKLIVLSMAKAIGLVIPETYITNQKNIVSQKTKEQELITKPINNPIYFYGNTYWLPSYTTRVDSNFIDNIESTFGLSLFQENIQKRVEIRSFFIDGDFYSMAIFSQNDDQTKTDFRCYNNEKPNRTIPFKVPIAIEHKLKDLAKQLDLNSCSFDLIYTTTKKFVFLEVNPVGQFGMVSYPCNYYLEEKIAQKLIHHDFSERSTKKTRSYQEFTL